MSRSPYQEYEEDESTCHSPINRFEFNLAGVLLLGRPQENNVEGKQCRNEKKEDDCSHGIIAGNVFRLGVRFAALTVPARHSGAKSFVGRQNDGTSRCYLSNTVYVVLKCLPNSAVLFCQ
jgi:hypothetical protein